MGDQVYCSMSDLARILNRKIMNRKAGVLCLACVSMLILIWLASEIRIGHSERNSSAIESPSSKSLPLHRATSWRLWHEMTPTEQEVQLERALARAAPYGAMLGQSQSKFHNNCPDGNRPVLFGKGGEHMVCGPQPTKCKFLSFGIRDDPSFDVHLAEQWDCRGFAGDPSITHPSKLHPAVTFHNIGLKMLRENVEQKKDPKDEWILATLPSLRKLLKWNFLDIVKIDCEGCEIAMSRDILAEDADFLNHVGQISIETHATHPGLTALRSCITTLCNSHCLKMQDSSSSGAVCSDVAGTSTMAACQKYRERWACRVETNRETRRTLFP